MYICIYTYIYIKEGTDYDGQVVGVASRSLTREKGLHGNLLLSYSWRQVTRTPFILFPFPFSPPPPFAFLILGKLRRGSLK